MEITRKINCTILALLKQTNCLMQIEAQLGCGLLVIQIQVLQFNIMRNL